MPNAAAAASGANKLGRVFYNTFVKRNSVFIATIFVTAFAFEMTFDQTTDRLWDNINKGVSARRISVGQNSECKYMSANSQLRGKCSPKLNTAINLVSEAFDLCTLPRILIKG